MLTGQMTSVEAAAEACVDRSKIITLRKTTRDGAIAALQSSAGPAEEATRVHRAGRAAGPARLAATVEDQAIELAALRGKVSWG